MNEVVNTQAGLKAFKLNHSAPGHFDFNLSVIEGKNKATFVSWFFSRKTRKIVPALKDPSFRDQETEVTYNLLYKFTYHNNFKPQSFFFI